MYFNAHYCNDPSMQIGSSTSSGLTFTAMRSSFSGSSSVSLAGSNNAITLGSNTLANANVDCMCLSSLQLPSSVYASSSTSWYAISSKCIFAYFCSLSGRFPRAALSMWPHLSTASTCAAAQRLHPHRISSTRR